MFNKNKVNRIIPLRIEEYDVNKISKLLYVNHCEAYNVLKNSKAYKKRNQKARVTFNKQTILRVVSNFKGTARKKRVERNVRKMCNLLCK